MWPLLISAVALPLGSRMTAGIRALGAEGSDKAVVTRNGGLQPTRGVGRNVHQHKGGFFVGDAQGLGIGSGLPLTDVILYLAVVQH